MAEFFDYICDRCARPYCERISIMNLALDLVEEAYCLECLAEDQGLNAEAFYTWILDYVESRECFQTPWHNYAYQACPRITDKSCFCTLPEAV